MEDQVATVAGTVIALIILLCITVVIVVATYRLILLMLGIKRSNSESPKEKTESSNDLKPRYELMSKDKK